MLRVIWVCLGVWLVACSGEAPEPAPAPAPIVQKQEEKPVDPCENPPPHDCCRGTSPECNRCRATYEGYIRSCPDAVDKRVRVPVDNNMEWAGGLGKPQKEQDTDSEQNRDLNANSGVHFRSDSPHANKSFLTCDELEESLCCRGDTPDCMACRSRAQSVISQCRLSGEGGIRVMHSPVGQPGNMDAGPSSEPMRNVPSAPELQ